MRRETRRGQWHPNMIFYHDTLTGEVLVHKTMVWVLVGCIHAFKDSSLAKSGEQVAEPDWQWFPNHSSIAHNPPWSKQEKIQKIIQCSTMTVKHMKAPFLLQTDHRHHYARTCVRIQVLACLLRDELVRGIFLMGLMCSQIVGVGGLICSLLSPSVPWIHTIPCIFSNPLSNG